jgi:hypothetical protein
LTAAISFDKAQYGATAPLVVTGTGFAASTKYNVTLSIGAQSTTLPVTSDGSGGFTATMRSFMESGTITCNVTLAADTAVVATGTVPAKAHR